PEVGIAVAVTAAVTAAVAAPPVRRALRRGAVYGLAGLLIAGDKLSALNRNARPSAQQMAAPPATRGPPGTSEMQGGVRMDNHETRLQSQTPLNEAHQAGSNGVAADEAREQAMERAEELVDQIAERVGYYTGVVGHQILKLAARAREEAEDIWAEAQSLRR